MANGHYRLIIFFQIRLNNQFNDLHQLKLQFEWAWQNPKESRRLKHMTELKRKLPRETNFNYNFRILSEMLRVGPWNRLPLTIRWLAHDFIREFPVGDWFGLPEFKSPPKW